MLPARPFEERGDAVLGEAAEQDLLGQPLAQEVGEHGGERAAGLELGVAVGPDDEHRDLRQPLRQVLDQEQRRLVGPVQVLEDEHQRRVARGALDELGDAVQQVAALLLGRQRHRLGDVGVADAQLGHELGDLGRVLAERLAQHLGRHLARRLLDVLDGGQVGRRALLVDAVAGEHAQTEPPRLGGRLLDEARLADAGLAADEHESRPRRRARAPRRAAAARAPGRVPTNGVRSAPGRTPVALGVRPRHLPEAPGRVDALERELAAVFELAARRAEDAVHRIGGEDRRARRHRLDALGDDQRLAVQAAVLVQHLAGVQADAQLQGELRAAAVPARDGALDLLRAGDGATRRLERHHEPVAGVRDDDAALLVDLLAGQLGQLALDRRRGVVAEALVEERGADEVGREHGDGALGERDGVHAHARGSCPGAVEPTRVLDGSASQ